MRLRASAALPPRLLRRDTGHRNRSAAEQRRLDVALTVSRQGIRVAPVRRN